MTNFVRAWRAALWQNFEVDGGETHMTSNFIVQIHRRGSIHTLKENAEALVAATREIGLEVSADKTKYMVMSRDQNAG